VHFDCSALAQWTAPGDAEQNIRWARDYWDAMHPYFDPGVYVNNLGDEVTDRVKAAYGSNYERLVGIKTKYDPDNVFRLNQNIKPVETQVS
jgi:FAD/FMN-containing dehydrogenase